MGSSSQHREPSFASSLSTLLNASQGQGQRRASKSFETTGVKLESLPEHHLRPSTFGCLVLINALHNYIWETRQHHQGSWSQQDHDRLHAHVEPALRAWQAAWSCNSDHSLERPNPFGASSLSADCIPLLDLAYVRLNVDLGKSKELFFQRDWDAMASELATGSGIVQHAEHQSFQNTHLDDLISMDQNSDNNGLPGMDGDAAISSNSVNDLQSQCSVSCKTREVRLRQAASYAANSLMMSDRLGVTFADFNSHELPSQSALCAFDCTQILAEWISTVQQRVGPYLGLLGKDQVELRQAPASMFLDEEDCKLLEKVQGILAAAELKLNASSSVKHAECFLPSQDLDQEQSGYACKILSLHARMFEREAVWPVFREMSQALRTQAAQIRNRAEATLSNPLHEV